MTIQKRSLKLYGIHDIDRLPQLQALSEADRLSMKIVASVFPFRCNSYVVEELIDWDAVPADPIYRLTFPNREMLSPSHFELMEAVVNSGADAKKINRVADQIRRSLNPHPDGQSCLNVPGSEGVVVSGVQHKYRETVLVFPAPGQTCHAYCTYCFRWPQFVKMDNMKFAARQAGLFWSYIANCPEVTDVLLTGGDPLIAATRVLEPYLLPLLNGGFDHITTVRIGTKAVAYWPHRFVNDPDADDLLRLFERIVSARKHLALMAHFDHPNELSTTVAQEAIRRIRETGAEVRTQAPMLRGINDSAETWSTLWKMQVRLGCVPYYVFVERQTGAKRYFEIPLVRTWEVYREAVAQVSGIARTARGPVMSALPGKVVIEGVSSVSGQKVFVLSFVQGRNPDWVKRPFFAEFDPCASWLTDLRPAFGAERFFFEEELARMQLGRSRQLFRILAK